MGETRKVIQRCVRVTGIVPEERAAVKRDDNTDRSFGQLPGACTRKEGIRHFYHARYTGPTGARGMQGPWPCI